MSTVIMLRSIADIARSEGEDLSDPEAALSCVEVFALGGRAGSADASESGYFAVRSMLAKTVTEAARFVAERGVIKEGAPILLKFVTQGRRTLRIGGQAEGRRAGAPTGWRPRRSRCELRVHRALSGRGPRPFHGATPGAHLRQGKDPVRIRSDLWRTLIVDRTSSQISFTLLVIQPRRKLTWNQTEPGTLAGRGRTAIRNIY
jgi:EcsC protein family